MAGVPKLYKIMVEIIVAALLLVTFLFYSFYLYSSLPVKALFPVAQNMTSATNNNHSTDLNNVYSAMI